MERNLSSLRPRPERTDLIEDQVQGAQSRGLHRNSWNAEPMYEKLGKLYWVYIMASRPRGVLYVGMTSDRPGRAWQHRERVREGFTRRYWVGRLVYFERYEEGAVAARRERALKRWRRDWKIELIEKHNPTWRDLFSEVLAEEGFEV